MVDNFESIKKFFNFENEGDFYFIQILRRKKENPDMNRNVSQKRVYYIYNTKELENCKESIINTCKQYNARAYIHINKRNAENIALHTLKITMDHVLNKNYKNVKDSYNKACGKHSSAGKEKCWIVDIDNLKELNPIKEFLNNSEVEVKGELKTVNGRHLLVKPFDTRNLLKNFNVDIHKDNPTLLYYESV